MRALVGAAFVGLVACSSSTPPSHGDHQFHHRFEDANQWTRVFDDPARDEWQKPADVVAAMQIEPGMTVVDLGAGTGYFLPYLAKAAGESGKVVALDVEADMIRFMKERIAKANMTNAEARVVPTDDPQLAPGSAHRILIVDTWHHIGEREAYSKKLAAALAPNGKIYIVDFTMETEKGPPKMHRIEPKKVIEELAAAGLTGEAIEEPLPDQYIVAARKN